MLVIDGSVKEGGGQILRISVALSCLLGFPLRIEKIRGNRKRPGLQPQHLSSVKLVETISSGEIKGAEIDSTTITFYPRQDQSNDVATSSKEKEREESSSRSLDKNKSKKGPKGGRNSVMIHKETGNEGDVFLADTQTAGSVTLLLQASLPCLIFRQSDSSLILKGGTNTLMAPQFEYVEKVFRPTIKRVYGDLFNFDLEIVRRGFYPKGGGELRVNVKPLQKGRKLSPFSITERGDISKISIFTFAAGRVPFEVCSKINKSAIEVLQTQLPLELISQPENVKYGLNNSYGDGSGAIIVAQTTTGCLISGTALLERGVSAETTGMMAAQELLSNINNGGCVDEFLQDQLIIFMGLAEGESRLLCGPLSLHTETAIHVVSSLTKANFQVTPISSTSNLITCIGIGHCVEE